MSSIPHSSLRPVWIKREKVDGKNKADDTWKRAGWGYLHKTCTERGENVIPNEQKHIPVTLSSAFYDLIMGFDVEAVIVLRGGKSCRFLCSAVSRHLPGGERHFGQNERHGICGGARWAQQYARLGWQIRSTLTSSVCLIWMAIQALNKQRMFIEVYFDVHKKVSSTEATTIWQTSQNESFFLFSVTFFTN